MKQLGLNALTLALKSLKFSSKREEINAKERVNQLESMCKEIEEKHKVKSQVITKHGKSIILAHEPSVYIFKARPQCIIEEARKVELKNEFRKTHKPNYKYHK
jgi:hypothetical protein